LVVAASAWVLLNAPEARDARRQAEASQPEAGQVADIAFFPLTLPFTTGPGTIAGAIALGSNRPEGMDERLGFYLGTSLAALA
ncbi:MarC family protein, partial [Enterobacter cloacae]|uniref:MarC family protein n=1 Tax=Enterobacter cloacae TaxID=550 RepID=UPI0023B82266